MRSNLGKNIIRTILSRAAMLGWCIWKARNEFIFQSLSVVVKSIALKLEQAWKELKSLLFTPTATTSGNDNPSCPNMRKWMPPEKGKLSSIAMFLGTKLQRGFWSCGPKEPYG